MSSYENEPPILKTETKVEAGGFLFGLTLLLAVLKLACAIDISWLWVLSPLWIGPALVVFFALLVGLLFFIMIKKFGVMKAPSKSYTISLGQYKKTITTDYWEKK